MKKSPAKSVKPNLSVELPASLMRKLERASAKAGKTPEEQFIFFLLKGVKHRYFL